MERTYKAIDMNSPATQRAITNCRKQKMTVRCLSFTDGLFTVPSRRNPEAAYLVQLILTPTGKLLYRCSCEAGMRDLLCAHTLAAAALWYGITQSRRIANERAAEGGGDAR